MNENSLRANLADLAQEIRLLGDRIRAVAPSPLDEVGRPAPFVYRRSSVVPRGMGALPREPLTGRLLGSRLEAVKPGGLTYCHGGADGAAPSPDRREATVDRRLPSEPLTTYDLRLTGSRVLRHIEDRSLADWISAEVFAYDRKELREAVAKLRDMFRKLVEDLFRRLAEQAFASGLSALGSGSGLLTSHFSPLTNQALGSGSGLLTSHFSPLTNQALGSESGLLTSHFSPLTNRALGSESGLLTSHFSPLTAPEGRHETHFHIHDAAAVAPILRNKNAMLVRTAALIDQQRALTRRPRGR